MPKQTADAQAPAGDALDSIVADILAQSGGLDMSTTDETPVSPAPDSASAEAISTPDSATTETPAPTEPAPTGETQDEAKDETSAEAETTPDEQEKTGTRRQRGEQLRQQIAAELEAKYEARLKELADSFDERVNQRIAQFKTDYDQEVADRQARQVTSATADQEQAQLQTWAKGVADGDWESTEALAKWAVANVVSAADGKEPPKIVQEFYRQGREAAYKEITDDFQKLKTVDGIDESGFQTLLKAASVPDLVVKAIELGKHLQQSVISEREAKIAERDGMVTERDEKITLLETQIAELKGKLAGKSVSPEGAGGSKATPPRRVARNLDEAAAMALEELR